MNLRGYRTADEHLLRGHWMPNELLGLPLTGRPPLAEPVSVAPPADHRGELCVVPGVGFVRYAELDWVHRRARLEIGVTEQPDVLEPLVKAAVTHGLRVLNLHRVYGWVTPATRPRTDVLAGAGLRREATVPQAGWLDGQPVDREIWGVVRDDESQLANDLAAPRVTTRRARAEGTALRAESPTGAELNHLDPAAAAAALSAAGERARGFLGLDPVTQNEALLTAELTRADAMVFRSGDTVLGCVLNAGQPRQSTVASTSADPAPVRALLEFLNAYKRCTSFVAAVPDGAEAGTAFERCGFTATGTLPAHRFQSGGYRDVRLYVARLEDTCGT